MNASENNVKNEDKCAKTWYVPCSPRSPEKIAPELRLMALVEGKVWGGSYTKKQHKKLNLPSNLFNEYSQAFTQLKQKNQEFIAKKLAELPDFKGNTHEKEISFSIRDRVAPMKTFGFIYVDSNNKIRITEAGKMIIEHKRPKEVFLKQMLKWQYPSYQHGIARPHPFKYQEDCFNIFPFIAVLNLIKKLDGLTKYEIAMFCLPLRKFEEIDLLVNEIIAFREELSKIKGKNFRKQFIYDYHFNRFIRIYEQEYNIGKRIREGKTDEGLKNYIRTKLRNSFDIADSTIRYFRYTGILSSNGNRIVLLQERLDDINNILSQDYQLVPYGNVEEFYLNYGDHTLPKLKYENEEIFIQKINKLHEESIKLLEKLKEINPNSPRKIIEFDSIDNCDLETLKDIYYEIYENRLLLKRDILVLELQNTELINKKIIPDLEIYKLNNKEINEIIESNYITDKNSVFEYVVWKAMIALGNAIEYRNNFLLDENLDILNHAAGNQGDIEIEYEKFLILVEVTTSKGVMQFKMESEPVSRHYENLQMETKKPVYCLFIAKEVNENTYKEFFRYNKIKKTRIIPLDLQQFINILKKQGNLLKNNKKITDEDLQSFLDTVISYVEKSKTYLQWKNEISKLVNEFVH